MLAYLDINFSRKNLSKKNYHYIPASAYTLNEYLQKSMMFLCKQWDSLEPDNYLKTNVPFRYRRLGYFNFIPKNDSLCFIPSKLYFQDANTNSYAGGINRVFAQINEDTVNNTFLLKLIRVNFSQFPIKDRELNESWKIDVHLFRVIANNFLNGLPSPEGIHRDGDQFEAIHLIKRENILGGENQIYTNDKSHIDSFMLSSPLDTLLLVDTNVMHYVTEIRQKDSAKISIRDALVIGYNKH